MIKMYTEEEVGEYQLDIKHMFHDEEQTFEVYHCPTCNGNFLVESEVLESIEEMWCPYCKTTFKGEYK